MSYLLERRILAILLSDQEVVPVAMRLRLRPDDFQSEPHRTIWRAACNLWERNEPVDVLTVVEEAFHADGLTPLSANYVKRIVQEVAEEKWTWRDFPNLVNHFVSAESRAQREPTVWETLDEVTCDEHDWTRRRDGRRCWKCGKIEFGEPQVELEE